MKPLARLLSLLAALAAVAFAWTGAAAPSGLSAAADDAWLKTAVYADREPLARGSEVRLAVVLQVGEGYHLNANPASAKDLVATQVRPEPSAAVEWTGTVYPPGKPLAAAWAGQATVSVYEGRAIVLVSGRARDDAPLGGAEVRLALSYQGCSAKACFPPAARTLATTVTIAEAGAASQPANAAVFAAAARPESAAAAETDLAAALQRSFVLYLALLVLLGLGLNLTPCVFPLIPVTMTVFAQQGEGRAAKVLPLAALYALGIAATFTGVGVLAALAGQSIGLVLQQPVGVLVVVAILAVLMASTFGAFDIQLPSALSGRLGARRGLLGAVFMGMVMGAIAAPCVGPFLLALITFIATVPTEHRVLLGAGSFFFTGLGLGLPYVVLGTFTGLLARFPRAGGWLVWTKRLLGMTLAGLILWFVHPYIKEEFLRPLVLGVFLFAAAYLGFVEGWSRRPFSKRFWAVRIAAALVILAVGAAYGYVTAPRPSVEWQPWTPDAIQKAKAEGKPVLLYFGADWCFPCKVWKYRVFSDPTVIERSRAFVRIEVDLTNLEEGPEKDFARGFDSVNPPGVFVLGKDGRRLAEFRDPVSAKDFAEALGNAAPPGQ